MPQTNETPPGGISKWKLALGAASLFLFIVGVKRSFRTEEGKEIHQREAEERLDRKRGDRGHSR